MFSHNENGAVRMANGQSLADYASGLSPAALAQFKKELAAYRDLITRKADAKQLVNRRESLAANADAIIAEIRKSRPEQAHLMSFLQSRVGQNVTIRAYDENGCAVEATVEVVGVGATDVAGKEILTDYADAFAPFVLVLHQGDFVKTWVSKIISAN